MGGAGGSGSSFSKLKNGRIPPSPPPPRWKGLDVASETDRLLLAPPPPPPSPVPPPPPLDPSEPGTSLLPPNEALPMDPALPNEDPDPGNGFGGVRDSISGLLVLVLLLLLLVARPLEKKESVLDLEEELDFVEETELERVGRPPTEDQTRPVEEEEEVVGEREEDSREEEGGGGGGGGPKSEEEGSPVGEGRVTSVWTQVNEEMDPFEVDELM